MIISIDSEKAFDKIQHPFFIKTLQKMGIEGSYLNIVRAIHDKPTANIILNSEKMRAFPLRSHHYYSTQFWKSQLQQSENKINKRNPDQKREVKLSLFADDMIWCIENPKDSIRKLLELISKFSKVAGYKINIHKSLAFLCANNEKSEREFKE